MNRSDEAYGFKPALNTERMAPEGGQLPEEPPSVSELSAASEAARKRVEAQQPSEKELVETRVRCHVADALSSLYAALVACENRAVIDKLITALDEVKSAQLELRKQQGTCDTSK